VFPLRRRRTRFGRGDGDELRTEDVSNHVCTRGLSRRPAVRAAHACDRAVSHAARPPRCREMSRSDQVMFWVKQNLPVT
jgi:hypothetical protein